MYHLIYVPHTCVFEHLSMSLFYLNGNVWCWGWEILILKPAEK